MARGTRKRRPAALPTKPKHNWANKLTRESRQRDRLLDKGQENFFRYDMEDILRGAEVPLERATGYIATLFAKGSRQGVEDAKEFATAKMEEGLYDENTLKTVLRLIENYSTWR